MAAPPFTLFFFYLLLHFNSLNCLFAHSPCFASLVVALISARADEMQCMWFEFHLETPGVSVLQWWGLLDGISWLAFFTPGPLEMLITISSLILRFLWLFTVQKLLALCCVFGFLKIFVCALKVWFLLIY